MVTFFRKCPITADFFVVEDSAQGVMGTYKGRALGTIGDMGCYSFHETKNYSMGEGGALMINDPKYNERAEIIREKGTNRARFFRGQVDKVKLGRITSSPGFRSQSIAAISRAVVPLVVRSAF